MADLIKGHEYWEPSSGMKTGDSHMFANRMREKHGDDERMQRVVTDDSTDNAFDTAWAVRRCPFTTSKSRADKIMHGGKAKTVPLV